METEASMKLRHEKEALEDERARASMLRGLFWLCVVTSLGTVGGSITAAILGALPAEGAAGISMGVVFLLGLLGAGLWENVYEDAWSDIDYKHKIERKQLEYNNQIDKDIKEMMNDVG